jgi:hypothetical protein
VAGVSACGGPPCGWPGGGGAIPGHNASCQRLPSR